MSLLVRSTGLRGGTMLVASTLVLSVLLSQVGNGPGVPFFVVAAFAYGALLFGFGARVAAWSIRNEIHTGRAMLAEGVYRGKGRVELDRMYRSALLRPERWLVVPSDGLVPGARLCVALPHRSKRLRKTMVAIGDPSAFHRRLDEIAWGAAELRAIVALFLSLLAAGLMGVA